MKITNPLLLTCSILLFSISINAQDSTSTLQRDIIEVLFPTKTKKKEVVDSIQIGKIYSNFLPIVGYSPALGFVGGVGISAALMTGPSNTTHLSSGLSNISYTTKNQINLNIRSNIFLPNDKWILQGDWRLLIFAQPTSGLGVRFGEREPFNIGGMEVDAPKAEQPMRFNYIRFYENVYKQINGPWYAGMGLNIDSHFSINDQSLDTTSSTISLTSHYLYSRVNDFNLTAYTTAGISFNVLYDNRDNAINPSKGRFFQFSYRVNTKLLGSAKASTTMYYEYRNYWKVGTKKTNPSMLGIWTWGQFLVSGTLPYLALPAITWDMYNRSGRGYVQGRIRGENFWYGETEYRFPITKDGLLGGVGFVNLSSASNLALNQHVGDAFAVGYGVGLRVKMNKKTNTNITIDYGRGKNGSSGIYFNLQETF